MVIVCEWYFGRKVIRNKLDVPMCVSHIGGLNHYDIHLWRLYTANCKTIEKTQSLREKNTVLKGKNTYLKAILR